MSKKGLHGKKKALSPKTTSSRQFARLRNRYTKRLNIISEGDSWFAYPPKWLVGTKQSNLIDWISTWTKKKANFYMMESNGDEAVDMVSGEQKHELIDQLRWHEKSGRRPVDLLLFSGGGNDLVGENDFERFILPKKGATSADEHVDSERLERKILQIGLAVEELLDIRDHYSRNTIIITHTYDHAYPSTQGGKFLGGLIDGKSWLKPYMDEMAIAEELQADVIKIFMDSVAEMMRDIASRRDKFVVADTIGTLDDKSYWLNEIHPTSKGFEILAKIMWKEITDQFPKLK